MYKRIAEGIGLHGECLLSEKQPEITCAMYQI